MTASLGLAVLARRELVEVVVAMDNAKPMRAAGHGDPFRPEAATFHYDRRGDGSAGELVGPVRITGTALAATVEGPQGRGLWIARAALMPTWLIKTADWARGATVAR